MHADADALVIGAGPAGAATAILLAEAGWRVILVEQQAFPRQKVCGECLAPGGLEWLERLGVGASVRRIAGPPLRRIAWMRGSATVIADLPPCRTGAHRFGRALGRDRLDGLLLDRARAGGVVVLQPARVRRVDGSAGDYACLVQPGPASDAGTRPQALTLRAPVVIDAHGGWERPPATPSPGRDADAGPGGKSGMLAFKASFHGVRLDPGLLPVLALPGACGGLVVAEAGRTTLACCIRRDALQDCRAAAPGLPAGAAIERWLRRHSAGVDAALADATRDGDWLAVGPVRPGPARAARCGSFAVGNAAGETHPLVGEGIGMALQSAALLASRLGPLRAATLDGPATARLRRDYVRAWRAAFLPRLWLADAFAQLAMRPALAAPAGALIGAWPGALTLGSRLAGKARRAVRLDSLYGDRR